MHSSECSVAARSVAGKNVHLITSVATCCRAALWGALALLFGTMPPVAAEVTSPTLILPAAEVTSPTATEAPRRKFLELKVRPAEPTTGTIPAVTPTSGPAELPPGPPSPAVSPPKPAPAPLSPAQQVLREEQAAQKLFDSAAAFIKRDRIDEAKSLLSRLARQYPRTEAAPRALIQMAQIESDLSESDNLLTRVIADYPNSEWAELAWLRRGEVNMLLWDYANALKMFDQFLQRNPRSREAGAVRFQIAVCHLKLNQPDKALQQIQAMAEADPLRARQPDVLETIAECHVELERCDQALAMLEQLARQYPNYANFSRVYLFYGLCLEDQGRFEDAKKAYANLVEQFRASPEAGLARKRLADLRRPLFAPRAADDSAPPTLSETPVLAVPPTDTAADAEETSEPAAVPELKE